MTALEQSGSISDENEGQPPQKRPKLDARRAAYKVRKCIQQLRICTPDTFPDLQKQLEDTLVANIGETGLHRPLVELEATKGLEIAEFRVDHFRKQRETRKEESRVKEAIRIVESAINKVRLAPQDKPLDMEEAKTELEATIAEHISRCQGRQEELQEAARNALDNAEIRVKTLKEKSSLQPILEATACIWKANIDNFEGLKVNLEKALANLESVADTKGGGVKEVAEKALAANTQRITEEREKREKKQHIVSETKEKARKEAEIAREAVERAYWEKKFQEEDIPKDEFQIRLGEITTRRATRLADRKAFVAVQRVIQKLRICLPETIVDLKDEVQREFTAYVDMGGEELEKLTGEVDAAKKNAEFRVRHLEAQRVERSKKVAAKQASEVGTAAIQAATAKMRLVKEEDFDETKRELDAALDTHLASCGAQQDTLSEEAQKSVELAEKRFQFLRRDTE